jgi:hypothetical protein
MALASSAPFSNKRKRGEEPEEEFAITVIGPVGPTEEHRKYKIGERIELLGLSAIVGDPRLGLYFEGQMKLPLWKQINNIICDIIDEEEDKLEELEKSGEVVDSKFAAHIESLGEELERIPEQDFVADVYVFIEHANHWKQYNILGREYQFFFGLPYSNDEMFTASLHIQLAKPKDVIAQLRLVGPETISHGLFAIGIERGEDGTGYCEDWQPLS